MRVRVPVKHLKPTLIMNPRIQPPLSLSFSPGKKKKKKKFRSDRVAPLLIISLPPLKNQHKNKRVDEENNSKVESSVDAEGRLESF